MHILVTGGAGFIGSNLVRRLLASGHRVTVYDNFTTGHEQNLTGVPVQIIRDSISNFASHSIQDVDAIMHLGMPSTMMLYRNDSMGAMREATQGMHAILEACRAHGCKLVFASSSSVYNKLALPHNESRDILITDFYTEARIYMERLAHLYSDLYGVHASGFRFFAVYGPHEEAKKGYANMISQFLWAVMKGEAPRVFGDGTQTRDFTYVDDVTRILEDAVSKDFEKTEIFNIGTAHTYTFNDIIRVINETLGKNVAPIYVENPIKNYVQFLVADIGKLRSHFEPPAIQLQEGIKKLVAYYTTESQPPKMENMENYYVSKIPTR